MEGAPRRVIAMDEAGNTGENLLDEDQPVFAIGAVDISIADAEALVNPILREAGVAELKFSRLRRSNAGRRNILRLVQGAAERGRVCLTAAHKPWMLAAKLVDELVEPTMLARGQQAVWYASGQHVEMTERLYADGPRALGELYEDLARAFVPLVRDYSSEFATEFLAVLRRCRIACRDDGVKEILDLMVDTEPGLAHEFDEREDALDPAVTLVWFEGGYWSQQLREPFEIVHDDSATVQRWQDRLVIARSASGEEGEPIPRAFRYGHYQVLLPADLEHISFSQSHRDARLQVADILAGAGAHECTSRWGLRGPDDFGRRLSAHIRPLIQWWMGPDLPR